jgi:hypothetical protein
VRNAPVGYVVRAVAAVNATPPARQAGDPHSVETGSIEGDLTEGMTHNHPLYKAMTLPQPSLHSVVHEMGMELSLP